MPILEQISSKYILAAFSNDFLNDATRAQLFSAWWHRENLFCYLHWRNQPMNDVNALDCWNRAPEAFKVHLMTMGTLTSLSKPERPGTCQAAANLLSRAISYQEDSNAPIQWTGDGLPLHVQARQDAKAKGKGKGKAKNSRDQMQMILGNIARFPGPA
jgi:hypothetical protein